MNKVGFLALGSVVLSSFLAAAAGCGGGTTGGGGSGGGTTSTSTTSTSTSTSGSSASTTTSTSSSGGGVATCMGYCTAIMANCKVAMDPGATSQYKDMNSCMNACASFPQGMPGATSGDSLECRNYHAGAAAMAATTHCEHAGPTGGGHSGAMADDGPCGNGCEAFCNLAAKACTGANSQYMDPGKCMMDCQTFKKTTVTPYSILDTDKNDFGCRMYHLSVAATDAMSAMTHCPHIVAASAVCIK